MTVKTKRICGPWLLVCMGILPWVLTGCGDDGPADVGGGLLETNQEEQTPTDASGVDTSTVEDDQFDGLCISGTFKCEGLVVFRCVSGGAWVYAETCTNGLSCVPSIGGCACVPKCAGKTCGPDGCGDVCGICDEGTVCSPTGQCTDDCNPNGTGILLGDHAADVLWKDGDGETFTLHSQCKTNKAIVVMETALW